MSYRVRFVVKNDQKHHIIVGTEQGLKPKDLYFSRYRPKTVFGSRHGSKNPKNQSLSICAMLTKYPYNVGVFRPSESIPGVAFSPKSSVFEIHTMYSTYFYPFRDTPICEESSPRVRMAHATKAKCIISNFI